MAVNQEHVFARFTGTEARSLRLLAAEGEEHFSAPYCWRLSFTSSLSAAETAALLGKELACEIGRDSRTRYLQGVVTDLAMQQDEQGEPFYTATLQPRLALLKLGSNLAVFQHISVPDLVCQLLRRNTINNIELRLQGTYPPRDYCVQYRESDLNFINRLLESEGIYYFFRQTASQHTLILADHPTSHSAAAHPKLSWLPASQNVNVEGVTRWNEQSRLTAASVRYCAFNIDQAQSVEGECDSHNGSRSVKGIAFTDRHDQSKRDRLNAAARLKIEQFEAESQQTAIGLEAWWLSCGEKFTLAAPAPMQGEYYISTLSLRAANGGEGEAFHVSCQAEVIRHNAIWRPDSVTPVPQIPGVLTATVVGPSSEEIHTDEYGRIKIQFPWDRENKQDDSSSCWVRVSQPWGGGRFGALFIPRVGSEVVVGFLDGNPDRPLVTGTLFNGKNRPPLSLPQAKTQAGFISRSSLDGSVEEGNQLIFDDKKGEEKLLTVAQKDLELLIKNDLIAEIAREVKKTIGADRTTEITRGNDSLTLQKGDLNTSLTQGKMVLNLQQGDYSLTIKGHLQESLSGGNHSLNVSGGGSTVKADKTCVIESTQGIELKVGSNKIAITPAGITLSGTTIKIEGKATAELSGALVNVKGSGITQVKGGVVMIG